MLVRPWDSATEAEWRQWIADGHDFGQLVAVGPDRTPVITPTHFVLDGDRVLLHLARANPIWHALENDPRCVLTVLGDAAFIPGPRRTTGGTPTARGVPTSDYTSVQLSGTAELVDDPKVKAELLQRQLHHFQPDAGTAPVTTEEPPFDRLLNGLRGIVLHVEAVTAKFKYGDNKPVEMQRSIAHRLRERDAPGDRESAAQHLRRAELRT